MKGKLLTVAVVVLALFSVFNYVSNSREQGEIADLASAVEQKTNKTIVYNAKNGYTPIKGIDYQDGKNGLNAVSYSVTSTVIKEAPLLGVPGKSTYELWLDLGNTGSAEDFIESLKIRQDIRVNPETKDVETKYSDQRVWTVLFPCVAYRLVCPSVN